MGDAITVTTTGGSASATIASTAAAGGNTTSGGTVFVTSGNTITLPVETFTAGAATSYTSTVSCNNASVPLKNAALPASVTVVPADMAIVCTYGNVPNASTVTGNIFLDNGVGGTANDGILTGEAGIAGIGVSLTNCSGAVYSTVITSGTGAYLLRVPAGTAVGAPLCVAQTHQAGRSSTGASVGTAALPSGTPTAATGGSYTYTRAPTSDVIAFNWNGVGHNGLDFGVVGTGTFAAGGAKGALPGNTVTYAHIFTAHTGGSVVFGIPGATAIPAINGWSEKVFADPTCSGTLQSGSAQLFPPAAAGLPVVFGRLVCVIVQEFVPANAPSGASNDAKIQAQFTYDTTGPTRSETYSLDDVTTVSLNALDLQKEVRNVTQGVTTFGVENQTKSGEVLEYRITYTNNGPAPISKLAINDVTPAYTVFVSSGVGKTPASLVS